MTVPASPLQSTPPRTPICPSFLRSLSRSTIHHLVSYSILSAIDTLSNSNECQNVTDKKVFFMEIPTLLDYSMRYFITRMGLPYHAAKPNELLYARFLKISNICVKWHLQLRNIQPWYVVQIKTLRSFFGAFQYELFGASNHRSSVLVNHQYLPYHEIINALNGFIVADVVMKEIIYWIVRHILALYFPYLRIMQEHI